MATRIVVSRSHSFLATSSRWSGHSGAPSVGVGSASLSLRLPGFPSRRLIAVGFGAGPRSPIQQFLPRTGEYSFPSSTFLLPGLGGILAHPLLRDSVTGQTTFCEYRTTLVDSIRGGMDPQQVRCD